MTQTAFKHAWKALIDPAQAYTDMQTRTLETMVRDYLRVVIIMGVFAGILTLLWNLGRTGYYDFFLDVDVQYARMINYLSGRVFATMFGYLIAGTFGLFFISLLLNATLPIKYAQIFKLLFIAASPLLLTGWIPGAVIGALIWSIFLFIYGYRTAGKSKQISKHSIQQRD